MSNDAESSLSSDATAWLISPQTPVTANTSQKIAAATVVTIISATATTKASRVTEYGSIRTSRSTVRPGRADGFEAACGGSGYLPLAGDSTAGGGVATTGGIAWVGSPGSSAPDPPVMVG